MFQKLWIDIKKYNLGSVIKFVNWKDKIKLVGTGKNTFVSEMSIALKNSERAKNISFLKIK